jgi:hypothetical protein
MTGGGVALETGSTRLRARPACGTIQMSRAPSPQICLAGLWRGEQADVHTAAGNQARHPTLNPDAVPSPQFIAQLNASLPGQWASVSEG